MRISNFDLTRQLNTVEVSADVDGFRLWFRLPQTYAVSRAGDPFLASAIFPAMRQGESLEIDPSLPVSPKLLRNISLLQEIFHTWNPQQLKIIPVHATVSIAEPLNTGVMSFFSGGVDSTYTFLKHQDELSHVVYIHGFDFYFNDTGGGAVQLAKTDLKDLGQFVWKLMLPHSPVSAHLKGMLSETTQQVLATYRHTGENPVGVEAALIESLNKIITGQSIFESSRFAGVNLRSQTKELLVRAKHGEDISRLNRMLLEDAYPREISGKYSGIYQAALDRNTRFVQSVGKSLIHVETNHYSFGYRYNLSRNLTHGSCLGSIALLLGFPRVYVPSSHSYNQLFPWGSHTLTDRLWSNECIEVIHDGSDSGRTDKVRKITECEPALMNLRVCFDEMNVNCGKCSKCLRTMTSLRSLHASSMPFPPLPFLKELQNIRIGAVNELAFFKENVALAQEAGDEELARILVACMKKYKRRRLFVEIDRVLLGGFIKRAYRNIKKELPGTRRIDVTPPED